MLWAVFEIAPYKRYVFCGQSRKMIKINGASDLYNCTLYIDVCYYKNCISLEKCLCKRRPQHQFPTSRL